MRLRGLAFSINTLHVLVAHSLHPSGLAFVWLRVPLSCGGGWFDLGINPLVGGELLYFQYTIYFMLINAMS